MNSSLTSHGGHSAKVEMELHLHEKIISVNQVGPGFLLLDALTGHAPGSGILILRVDGNEHRIQVSLPEGIAANSERVSITVA
jgi:hypothetical protein